MSCGSESRRRFASSGSAQNFSCRSPAGSIRRKSPAASADDATAATCVCRAAYPRRASSNAAVNSRILTRPRPRILRSGHRRLCAAIPLLSALKSVFTSVSTPPKASMSRRESSITSQPALPVLRMTAKSSAPLATDAVPACSIRSRGFDSTALALKFLVIGW